MTWMPRRSPCAGPTSRSASCRSRATALAYLSDVLVGQADGGFFWGLDDRARISAPYTDGKHLYGNGFCLYGAAAAYQATKDPAALALAKRAFRWIDEHGHDAKNGGYFEWLTRDGKPVAGASRDRPARAVRRSRLSRRLQVDEHAHPPAGVVHRSSTRSGRTRRCAGASRSWSPIVRDKDQRRARGA